MDKEKMGGFGMGLLVGAAIGAALGILLAPGSGKETRTQIKEKASDLVEKAKEKASEIKQCVSNKQPGSEN